MSNTKLRIQNRNGEQLHATLELPADQQAQQYAIFAHCFTCNSDFAAVRNIGRELTNHGFGVLRFDFTGLGRSEGEFAESNFSANITDLEDVSAYLAQHYLAPVLIVGHSLGGAAALVAGARIDNIKAIVTIGAPAEAVHVRHLLTPGIADIEATGQAEVRIGGRPFNIKKQFLDDLEQTAVLDVVKGMRKALLIMHSPQDSIVGIDNAAQIYHSAFHPKSFVSLDGADHLLSKKEDSIYAAQVIGAWAGRYLSTVPKETLSPGEAQVVAHLNLDNNFTTQISNGRHTIVADEPASLSGADLGFSPHELLNSALGACTAMTLKLYAQRKKWPLREVYVYLLYSKRPADEVSLSLGQTDPVEHIHRQVALVGDLSAEQRQRLIQIAAKCPVHKTLAQPVYIETSELLESAG